jgi:hypothetical protein
MRKGKGVLFQKAISPIVALTAAAFFLSFQYQNTVFLIGEFAASKWTRRIQVK